MTQYVLIGGPAAGKIIETERDWHCVHERLGDCNLPGYVHASCDATPVTELTRKSCYYVWSFVVHEPDGSSEEIKFMAHESICHHEMKIFKELIRVYTSSATTVRCE